MFPKNFQTILLVIFFIFLINWDKLVSCGPLPGVKLDEETLKLVREQISSNHKLKDDAPAGFVFPESSNPQSRPTRTPQLNSRTSLASLPSLNHNCPKKNQRYHLESGTCHTIGTLAKPCGQNMLYYAVNQTHGDCDCNNNAEIPLVFHPESNQCYPIYDQAYCDNGDWLAFDTTGNPICEPRKCPANQNLVYFKNNCVKFGEHHKTLCSKTYEKVIFKPEGISPVCGDTDVSEQSSLSVPKLKCKSGSKQAVQGQCLKNIKFNFNG